MNLKEKEIIYVDNKPHIKCKIVLLLNENGVIFKRNSTGLHLYTSDTVNDSTLERLHLYVTSDLEIDEDDWCFDKHSNTPIFQYKNKVIWDSTKKIIATTNISLTTKGLDSFSGNPNTLPQPSQQFIEEFISEYNKNNQATEILVEVEEINNPKWKSFIEYTDYCMQNGYNNEWFSKYQLKLDSQNQITIKQQKDIWSREEHLLDINKCVEFICSQFDYNPRQTIRKLKDKWIEENI